MLYITFRIAKDERFERLPCMHKGIYADDCLVNRVTQVKPYSHIQLCCSVGNLYSTFLLSQTLDISNVLIPYVILLGPMSFHTH